MCYAENKNGTFCITFETQIPIPIYFLQSRFFLRTMSYFFVQKFFGFFFVFYSFA